MKTPVYDGEEGKISPSCPIWEPTLGVSMLLEKAALRRLILPAVLRELFLTGCALTPAVLAHCKESCCCLWSQDFPYKIAENPEKTSTFVRLRQLQKCKILCRNLAEIFNSERCKGGFSIGFQRCKGVYTLWISSRAFKRGVTIYLQMSASIQPRTGLSKFAKK